jgi:hypothetical protein
MMLIRIYRSPYQQEVFREAVHWQVHVQCNRFQSFVEQLYESRMKSTEKSNHALLERTGSKKSSHAGPKVSVSGSRTFGTNPDPRIQNFWYVSGYPGLEF